MSVWAGVAGRPGRVDGARQTARFRCPYSVVCDRAGNVLCDDAGNKCIRKLSSPALDEECFVSTLANLALDKTRDAPDLEVAEHELSIRQEYSRALRAAEDRFAAVCMDTDSTHFYGYVLEMLPAQAARLPDIWPRGLWHRHSGLADDCLMILSANGFSFPYSRVCVQYLNGERVCCCCEQAT
jgi:hypothetical protein